MSSIEKLTQLFMKFPGIGTRQARRFVYFLLAQDPYWIDTLAREITTLKREIIQCKECYRFYQQKNTSSNFLCDVCSDVVDKNFLMVVEKDSDFESMHRSGGYFGKYFILGGTIPVLEKHPDSKIRINELISYVESAATQGLSEIILALSVNPESDFTKDYIIKALKPITEQLGIAITTLGRGLSTGTELEYSDGETLMHALKNRG